LRVFLDFIELLNVIKQSNLCYLFFCWAIDVVLVWLLNRYAHDEETAEDQEETGWKYIHGDVFRFPKFKSVFAAALGSGTQLFTLWVSSGHSKCSIKESSFQENKIVILFCKLISINCIYAFCAVRCSYSYWHLLVYFIHTTEGLYSLHLLLYMHSLQELLAILLPHSIVNWKEQTGYRLINLCNLVQYQFDLHVFLVISDFIFVRTSWQVRNLLLTGCLFCGPLFLTFCFLNTVAIVYNATAALPFGTIVVIVLIWTLVTSPLLVLGGIAGKNSKAEFQAPVRTTKYPREIPPLPWYRGAIPQMAMAGFLPFSAIYIELYYIFASVWGHRIYTIYSILFIVFIILLIVTAFITVALTYFQLAAEDHEWWWRYEITIFL